MDCFLQSYRVTLVSIGRRTPLRAAHRHSHVRTDYDTVTTGFVRRLDLKTVPPNYLSDGTDLLIIDRRRRGIGGDGFGSPQSLFVVDRAGLIPKKLRITVAIQ